MGRYFLDTSAIVKRYIRERGQAWVLELCDPAQGHDLYISKITLVEAVAAFCKRAREKNISTSVRNSLINAFRQDYQDTYSVMPLTDAIYESAAILCHSYTLRAYDAVQLACALSLHNDALTKQVSTPTFVCADSALITIAIAAGLAVENPNNYPEQENEKSKP